MAQADVVDQDFVNDELNAEAREIRKTIPLRQDPGDLDAYIRCWSEDDVLDGKPAKALVIILKTRGCTWALAGGCTMCGYANESAWAKVSDDQLVTQFEKAFAKYDGEEIVKIYTSGSFIDPKEVPPAAQDRIIGAIGKTPKKVAFESLPGFCDDESFSRLAPMVNKLEVGIGVESSNDRVLRDSVNKGHPFSALPAAAEACAKHDVSVKAYLMCKPPYLKECDALADSTQTIIDAAPHSNIVSLNPTNVQGRTVVDAMFRRGSYRAPWLWTLVQALRDGDKTIRADGFEGTRHPSGDGSASESSGGAFEGILKSDVIAAGQSRGAHNCGQCDERVVKYLKQYKETQDRRWLDDCLANVQCDCRAEWELTLELGQLVPAYGQL